MPPTTFALVGQKGGTGKTTLTVCLAAELQRRGMRVLIVDTDPQASARTWTEVAAEAGQDAPTCVAMGAGLHRPGQLDRVAKDFDLVLIDCPPSPPNLSTSAIQRSVLMACDVAVLPCGPSPLDAWALASSLDLVDEAQALRPALKACIVLTKVQAATRIAQTARDALKEAKVPVLTAELGYRVAFQEALAAGQGVTTFATTDAAAAELAELCDELMRFAKSKARAARA